MIQLTMPKTQSALSYVAFDDEFIELLNMTFPVSVTRRTLRGWQARKKFVRTSRFISRKSPPMLRKDALSKWARAAWWAENREAVLAFEEAIGFMPKASKKSA